MKIRPYSALNLIPILFRFSGIELPVFKCQDGTWRILIPDIKKLEQILSCVDRYEEKQDNFITSDDNPEKRKEMPPNAETIVTCYNFNHYHSAFYRRAGNGEKGVHQRH